MRKRHLALISFVAAFSLLAFVFSTWMKPFNIESTSKHVSIATTTKKVSHSKHLFCSVPTSSSVFLAEVKPKMPGIGTGVLFRFALSDLLPQSKIVGSYEPKIVAVDNFPRPLWLLHRSLLI